MLDAHSHVPLSLQVTSPQGGKFSIQVCGALPTNLSASCRGAAVCLVNSRGLGSVSLQDGSFGSAASGVFQMDGEQLKLTFSDGQKCQHSELGECFCVRVVCVCVCVCVRARARKELVKFHTDRLCVCLTVTYHAYI